MKKIMVTTLSNQNKSVTVGISISSDFVIFQPEGKLKSMKTKLLAICLLLFIAGVCLIYLYVLIINETRT